MKLTINQREAGDVVVLDLAGHLSMGDELSQLSNLVTDLVAAGKTRVVINLKKVGFVDSSGAGTLVRCFTAAKAAGGDLKLAEPSERFRQVMELTRLVKILKMFPREQDALRSFS